MVEPDHLEEAPRLDASLPRRGPRNRREAGEWERQQLGALRQGGRLAVGELPHELGERQEPAAESTDEQNSASGDGERAAKLLSKPLPARATPGGACHGWHVRLHGVARPPGSRGGTPRRPRRRGRRYPGWGRAGLPARSDGNSRDQPRRATHPRRQDRLPQEERARRAGADHFPPLPEPFRPFLCLPFLLSPPPSPPDVVLSCRSSRRFCHWGGGCGSGRRWSS